MKKIIFCCLLFGGSLMIDAPVSAQLRSLPSAVTDSFKVKYPNAAQVSWSDKLGYWQASFYLGADELTAKFRNNGEWQSSLKKIAQTTLPADVQDGFSKSLYAGDDWKVSTVQVVYLPGDITQYAIQVEKSTLQKKNLLFNSKGRLIKENAAL
ncbi:MAG TPA: PepSY-like domain-containing protein [Puia sp.]|nr:PepSY-like domain-containing protein [Puia sp.]